MSKDPGQPLPSVEVSEAEVHLRRLFRLSLDLMCVAGFDGYFKRVNPAFERVLGYQPDELLARQFVEFVHPDDRDSTRREVERLSDGEMTIDFENRYRTHDGEYRYLAWRAAPMVDSGLIYAVARDITEQKADEELLARQSKELARSNADLEQFANVASHDLRAPLRSIVTLTRFIEEDLGEAIPQKTREHLEELRRRALRMTALTDDLLVYSQAGRQPDEIEEVDTGKLVRDVAFLLDAPDAFEIVADESLPIFETARGPLEQVLRNLIGNALKHHDRRVGRIEVSARDAGTSWELRVSDDGPGIPEFDRTHAFGLFPRDGSGRGERRGMGLALVQRIVERLGGGVEFESGSDRGAVVRFEWPKIIAAEPRPDLPRGGGDDAQTADH